MTIGRNLKVVSKLTKPVDLMQYVLRRLYEVGVRSVHGVPGDYNLSALDYIEPADMQWVGNVNELNAGYAADGYARVKGISTLFTTFGVGELSALNAMAGAYAEYVPIVHLVGAPSILSQRGRAALHHTLGDGRYRVFEDMSRQISCAAAVLDDVDTAPGMIDEAIRRCLVESRPAYISIPTDMVQKQIEGTHLEKPIDMAPPVHDTSDEENALEAIFKLISTAHKPAILVDGGAKRGKVLDEVGSLIEKSRFPFFVAPMGRGFVDETLPNYQGVYAGIASCPSVREDFESSDMILTIGRVPTDINTGGFTCVTDSSRLIEIIPDRVTVWNTVYSAVGMKSLLKRITNRVPTLDKRSCPKPWRQEKEATKDRLGDFRIEHNWIWPRFSDFLRENDIVVVESGTSSFGIWNTRLPKGAIALSQTLWASIGFSLGACQGASLASRDLNGQPQRTILIVGDGSFQLSVQELSTIIRNGLTPTIFVICNEGFTIERFIHGMHASYNDIQPWKFQDIPAAFGADSRTYKTFCVRTRGELNDLLHDEDFAEGRILQLVEVHLAKDDAPASMKAVAESASKRNTKT